MALMQHRTALRFSLISAALCVALALPSGAGALSRGSAAPEIGLEDNDGNEVTIAGLRGKVVLVDFFASWCRPCREELPVLNRLYDQYKDRGLVVVGVNIDRDRDNMRRFLRRTPVTFPVVFDGEHAVADRYRPRSMPSSYIIDREGIVRVVHRGFRASDAEDIEAAVVRLLGPPSAE